MSLRAILTQIFRRSSSALRWALDRPFFDLRELFYEDKEY